MLKKENVLVVKTDGSAISSYEFSEFFRYFRAAYVASLKLTHQHDVDVDFSDKEKVLRLANKLKLTLGGQDVEDLVSIDCGDGELEILDIKRENPLVVTFCGAAVALMLAVIVSGGKYKLGMLEAELPPLGEGIASLRKALVKGEARRKDLDEK